MHRKYLYYLLWKSNIFISLCSLVAFMAPIIKGSTLWIAGFVAYLIPLFLLLNALFVLFWVFKKPSRAILSFATLVFGYNYVQATVQFNNNDSQTNNLHVLNYNVRVFNKYDHLLDTNPGAPKNMINWINTSSADIVCLQEYYNNDNSPVFNTNKKIKEFYPYAFHFVGFTNRAGAQFGQSIYSKHPIINKGKVLFVHSPQNYGIYADIVYKEDTIRIYNAHFHSMKIDDGMLTKESIKEEPKNLLRKLKGGFIYRSIQADSIYNHIQQSPHPSIICADLNDWPYSYAYQHLKKSMKNAFEEKGNGLGFTYNGKIPFLRIDHQFADPAFEITYFNTHDDITWSDHFPISARYVLKE